MPPSLPECSPFPSPSPLVYPCLPSHCLQDGTPGKERLLPPLLSIQRDPATFARWVDYSTYDAESTWLLREVLQEKLSSRPWAAGLSLFDFYQRFFVPFAECLTDMERAGIRVDKEGILPAAERQALQDRAAHEKKFM